MEIILESLTEQWQSFLRRAPFIGAGLVVLLLAVVVGILASKGLVGLLRRTKFSPTHRDFFRKLTIWFFAFFGFVAALGIMGLERLATSVLAGGGITAIILGFAFRDVGENLLAGLFLAFSRPFDVGDLIRSGEFEGVVRGVDIRHTHIRSADGLDIFIPSSRIFGDPLVNFTRDGLRRPSFTVGIDHRDDGAEARRLLLETVEGVEGVLQQPPPGVVASGMTPQYLELMVFFWVSVGRSTTVFRDVRGQVMEACRRALAEGGFTFSSEVTTAVEMGGERPFSMRLEGGEAGAAAIPPGPGGGAPRRGDAATGPARSDERRESGPGDGDG